MNYLKELKAFRDWLLLNDLNTSAIALWHTLMAINNMTGWKERFNAPNSTVEKLTGLSKQGLVDARKKLIENGLIEYEKGKRGKAPIYKILSLVNSVDLYPYQSDYQLPYQSTYQSDDQSLTIPKHKLKQNETNITAAEKESNVFDVFYKSFGKMPTPLQIDEINYLLDNEQIEPGLISYGFEKASKAGANFNYAAKVFNSWIDKGIRTLDAALKEQKEFEARKGGTNAVNRTSPKQQPGPSKETERLEKIAREKGLIKPGEISDIDVPY